MNDKIPLKQMVIDLTYEDSHISEENYQLKTKFQDENILSKFYGNRLFDYSSDWLGNGRHELSDVFIKFTQY